MAKARRKYVEPQTHRPAVTNSDIQYIFAVVIRCLPVYLRAREVVKHEVFGEHETWLALLWHVVDRYYVATQKLPSKKMLLNRLNAEIETNPLVLSEIAAANLNDFLSWAYDVKRADFNQDFVLALLKQFMQDRKQSSAIPLLSRPQTAVNLAEIFEQCAQETRMLDNLTAAEASDPFAAGWDDTTTMGEVVPTGLSFFDSFLGGGASAQESYGILGPWGGGKTTLGIMIAGESCRAAYNAWINSGGQGQPAVFYHFCYEQSPDELKLLFLSYMAEIPKNELREIIRLKAYDRLSTMGNYKPYEQDKFRRVLSGGGQPPAEKERFEWAQQLGSKCLRLFDMRSTGNQISGATRGAGLVPEIASLIQQDVLARGEGAKVSGALVDYVAAAIDSHIQSHGPSNDELRTLISRWPLRMKLQIGVKFNCPVWSLHQLNADANSLRPGRLPLMTQAAEGRGFGENCDFCFILGTANRDGHLAFGCGKHRRNQQEVPIVLTLRGDMARLVDSRDVWVLDDRTKSIVLKQDRDQFDRATGNADPLGQSTNSSIRRLLMQQRAINGTPSATQLP